jgi:hypothetical protein
MTTRKALAELAEAEAHYRLIFQTAPSADHLDVGRAWDRMRKAGDAAREALAQPEPWTEAAAVDLAHRAGFAGTCWTMGPYELVHMLNLPAAPPPPARPPTAAENAVLQHAAEGG